MIDKSIGMKSLGLRNIGVRSVGCIGVPGRKKGAPVPPTPTPARILAKMQAEQPALYASLRLWYDPRLQGLTNEYIQEQAIESGTFYLENLQGDSRYDMRVSGMSGLEDDGYINEEGQLVFDGVDDYAITQNAFPFSGVTACSVICRVSDIPLALSRQYVSTQVAYVILMRNTDNSRVRGTFLGSEDVSYLINNQDVTFEFRYPSDIRKFNDRETVATRTRVLDTDSAIRLAYTSSQIRSNMIFHFFALFLRDLTDTESAWVRDNMINI